jgi:hypothetical protein
MPDDMKSKIVDVSSGTLPIIVAFTMMGFVAYATFILTTEKNRIDRRFEVTADLISELTSSTKELAGVVSGRTTERWTKFEMAAWCVEQKLKYPELICPPVNYRQGSEIDNHNELNRVQKTFEKIKEKSLKAIKEGDHPTMTVE